MSIYWGIGVRENPHSDIFQAMIIILYTSQVYEKLVYLLIDMFTPVP